MHTRKNLLAVGRLVIYAIIILITILPFIWMVTNSFKTDAEIFARPIKLLPRHYVLEGYTKAFRMIPVAKYMFNSAVVAVTVVLGGLFINSMAGYSFARLKFPGQGFLFLIILATLMIPLEVYILPLFLVVSGLGWMDTYLGLIIPAIPNAFSIFLLRQFMKNIPDEIEEAAIMDGCSWFSIFWRIAIPLSKPALVTVGILTFMWTWDSYLWPLVITTSEDIRVIQLGLAQLSGTPTVGHMPWNILMAASVVAALPTVLVFVAGQRYYVEGVARTGIKG